jgi:hypothetical protein
MPAPERAFADLSTHETDDASRAEPRQRVRVRYHYDPNADESVAWSATTRDGPEIHATARDYTRLRRTMRALVRSANGRRTQLQAEFLFPEPLSTELSNYQRDLHLVRSLEPRIRRTRMPLAYRILELRLAQADVAALLEITPGRFGALLQADAPNAAPSGKELCDESDTSDSLVSMRSVAE